MLFSALPRGPGFVQPRARVRLLRRRHGHRHPGSAIALRSSPTGSNALEHLEHRGAAGAEPNSGDGAGILLQLPVELLRDVVDFDAARADRRRLPTPSPPASASCRRIPSTRDAARERIESDRRRRGAGGARLARGPGRPGRRRDRRHRAGLYAVHGAVVRRRTGLDGRVRRHRPRPAGLPAAQARRGRRRGPAGVLRVAVESHHHLQGHAHDDAAAAVLPGSARRTLYAAPSRSCTAGSPPTPSRRGRWRTRSGSSPTTARSTPCAATATGCTPARRCWPAPTSAATCPGSRRSARRRRRTRRPSTRCWNCCISAVAACRTR